MWCIAVNIRGSVCRVQQRVNTLMFVAWYDYYHSKEFVCVSVILKAAYVDNLADVVDLLLIKMFLLSGATHKTDPEKFGEDKKQVND